MSLEKAVLDTEKTECRVLSFRKPGKTRTEEEEQNKVIDKSVVWNVDLLRG